MKKSILNVGKALNKTEQKKINGGFGCPGPFCYGVSGMGCGTCSQYHALPSSCKGKVLVHADCFIGIEPN
ncbi:hypothetical protein F7018_18055 [Tenacibaculum aiptasiae]|uniref:Bacteriocin n=1 Tax=Tenacibaculum aiptasiae TaxID=426481 RepID=A0A7J5A506_9FLAO|nr:hypothetical protein [Tenacibaculum aiptasiae]KAB1151713.1 hypothetical protein F7018_18055 [Tenacibaculum aiptasiae]